MTLLALSFDKITATDFRYHQLSIPDISWHQPTATGCTFNQYIELNITLVPVTEYKPTVQCPCQWKWNEQWHATNTPTERKLKTTQNHLLPFMAIRNKRKIELKTYQTQKTRRNLLDRPRSHRHSVGVYCDLQGRGGHVLKIMSMSALHKELKANGYQKLKPQQILFHRQLTVVFSTHSWWSLNRIKATCYGAC